ncbi:MAG: SH3 domain-containing protein [Oscillospiraceae bacterium]|nr:SH3 domain-containing protein [Oscillospiraceae bacterium]
MNKRITSLFLAVVILLSMMTIGVSAEQVMKISDDAIKILKAEEGFSKKPYWDYAQWTVGYGTKCPDDKLEEYKQNGIPEAEAEKLLKDFLVRFESELYKFMNKTGVSLTQNQFDALMLFSYNCGSGWSYDANGGLYNAVVSGATGNKLIDAFSRWCNAGGEIKTFLLRRRLSEANIYLNGVYSQTPPENFGYVMYDPCGGTVSPNIQGYDTKLTSNIIPKPTYSGYKFEGWYTERVGGKKVTTLNADVKNARLYAHWTDDSGKDPAQDATGVKVTVTTDGVNVRSGPGTDYKVISGANAGEELIITQTATGTGYTWGKFYGGWICLDYTTYDQVTKPEQKPEQEPETPKPVYPRKGTVKVSEVLRIRSGPSTGYSVVGYLNNGAKVEILEEKIAGSMIWGKISKGWISMDYVTLDPVKEETKPETKPEEETKPEQKPETKPEEAPKTWKGKVNVKEVLRIRSGPSTSYAVVGYLSPNETVVITEQKTSASMTWGKIDKGWISMDYIVLEKTETETKPSTITGTVNVKDLLRVRTGPGTSYAIAGYLAPKAKVEITEKRTVNGTVWGKIDKGWISMDYVTVSGSTSTTQKVTKTVTADCLRVRSTAGTSGTIVGYLYKGAKVTITSTKTVSGTKWGKISNGWISMDYVK